MSSESPGRDDTPVRTEIERFDRICDAFEAGWRALFGTIPSSRDEQVEVLLGDGDGTFRDTSPIDVGGHVSVDSLTPGDYNNDGRTDLAFFRTGAGPSQVGVLLSDVASNGAGRGASRDGVALMLVDPGATFPSGGVLATPDLDGDGRDDLVSATAIMGATTPTRPARSSGIADPANPPPHGGGPGHGSLPPCGGGPEWGACSASWPRS